MTVAAALIAVAFCDYRWLCQPRQPEVLMKLAKFTALASALLFSVVAIAQTEAPKSSATLADVDGSILVNSGEEFVAGVDGEVLMKGSRVMAMEGSTALLKYDDGCDVKVESGTVVTLSDGSPCAGWLLTVEAVAPGGLAVGATGAAAAGVSPWVYVPAVIVAGVLIAEELDDDPSSP